MIFRLIQMFVKPLFYVCEWEVQVSRYGFEMSGKFPCLGDTKEEAEIDAQNVLIDKLPDCTCLYKVRQATLFERLK